MAPRNAEAWSDANTLKFVMLVAFALGGSPAQHWAAIAEKMGDGYTPTALASKWQRLRAQVEKDGGLNLASGSAAAALSPATPKIKGAGRPRKATKATEEAEGADDDDTASTPGSKRKSTRVTRSATPKSKKVKTEGESEEGEKADSKESKESGEIEEI